MANYFDIEITDEAEKRIKEAGIEMHLGETVKKFEGLTLIHISEPTRLRRTSYAVLCLKKKIHHTH
ncbi:hypothetical protein, partial [Brachyspira hyodysenteriae]|uniref:hypothetical protein n=1 Tax=Brachyspira hyodysenteriae TaxID=159 RepID=UPI001F4D642D